MEVNTKEEHVKIQLVAIGSYKINIFAYPV